MNVVDPDVEPKQMVELAGAVTFKSARCTVVTSAVASSVAEPQGLVPGRVAFSTIVVLEALIDLGQVTVTCFLPIVAAATAASAASVVSKQLVPVQLLRRSEACSGMSGNEVALHTCR